MMNKKIFLSAAFALSLVAMPAMAQYEGPEATKAVSTVASVLQDAKDDTHVVLKGHIIEKLDADEKYMFKDTSGSIVVEIDNDELPAQAFNETTLVELKGEVDKDMMKDPEIDVDRVTIITE